MKRGCALSGGSGKGGYQAGVIYGLVQQGWFPDVLQCISVGALNGIMLATKQTERLKELWHIVTDEMIVRKRRFLSLGSRQLGHWMGIAKPPLGIWDNTPLKNLLKKELINKEVHCDYYCGGFSLEDGRYMTFHIPKGTVFEPEALNNWVDMIVASTAIPVLMDPVLWADTLWWDGGIHNHSPIQPLKSLMQFDHITIISTKSEREFRQPAAIRDIIDVASEAINSLIDVPAEADFKQFELINHIAKESGGTIPRKDGRGNYIFIPNSIHRPTIELGPANRFHHQFTASDFAHGLEQASGPMV